jgi:hypothetical protein
MPSDVTAVRQRLRNEAYLFVSLAHGFDCVVRADEAPHAARISLESTSIMTMWEESSWKLRLMQ